jgi:hypothetical protein
MAVVLLECDLCGLLKAAASCDSETDGRAGAWLADWRF